MKRFLHPVAASTELIRLGPRGDCGYLVPDDLAGIVAEVHDLQNPWSVPFFSLASRAFEKL